MCCFQGASFGYHAGGWGKPPVDEQGKPLYGDVFGIQQQEAPVVEEDEQIESQPWGELESESEEESESEVCDCVAHICVICLNKMDVQVNYSWRNAVLPFLGRIFVRNLVINPVVTFTVVILLSCNVSAFCF